MQEALSLVLHMAPPRMAVLKRSASGADVYAVTGDNFFAFVDGFTASVNSPLFTVEQYRQLGFEEEEE